MIDVLSTLILTAGFVDDVRSRKIHNKLLLALLAFAVIIVFALRGFSGLGYGLFSMLLATLLTYPLVVIGALGAGDLKLFATFAFTSDPYSVVVVYLYSLVAGAMIGLVRAALGGELLAVFRSTTALAAHRASKDLGSFNIPFSAALLLGWLVHWTSGRWWEGLL